MPNNPCSFSPTNAANHASQGTSSETNPQTISTALLNVLKIVYENKYLSHTNLFMVHSEINKIVWNTPGLNVLHILNKKPLNTEALKQLPPPLKLKHTLQSHFNQVQVSDKSDQWLMQIIRKLSTHIQSQIMRMNEYTTQTFKHAPENGIDNILNLIEQPLIPYIHAFGLNQLYFLDANTLSSLAYVCSFAMDFEPSETITELLTKAQLLDGISFAQRKQTFINSLKHQKPNSMTDFGEFRNDIDVMMAAVQLNGCAINGASDELKNNEALVEAALKNDGFALQFASDHLKANKRLVLMACANDGCVLQFANEDLIDDRDCVLAAVHNNGLTLEFAPDALKADLDVVKAALTQNKNAYTFVHDSIKQHPEVLELVLPANH